MTSLVLLMLCVGASADEATAARPNVLWISVEDISPDLGCYGDKHAVTPTIDRLAAEGVRFTRCFTHAGVCAPSRSGLITGCYPPSIGTHHMRCKGVPPDDVKCFPEYLRQAGYYCTNNVKTDYQFDVPATAWDENSNKADWRGRDKGQPFFSVINFLTTHESQIRDPSPATKKLVEKLSPEQRHDPAKMIVPPFYPDTPIVRRDIANYYDNITAVDGQVAAVLQRLEEDGLAEDTIVWFWGDHGRGMPRYKRWLYDTGLHVPLIVYVPEKWRKHVRPDNPDAVKPGSVIDDLTAFIDFAPTMLSLAGLNPTSQPDRFTPGQEFNPLQRPSRESPAIARKRFQGQAFFGPHRSEKPRDYVYGHRDRMDETYDLIRSVRDKRFRYVRNFMPSQPYSQDIAYMNEMPTMQEWRRLHAEGKLTGPQADWFRKAKPVEELYDTERDPYEVNNLAEDPRFVITLERLRSQLKEWQFKISDVGLIPEPIFDEVQRPGAKSDVTAAPGIEPMTEGTQEGFTSFRLSYETPGASLAYRIVGANDSGDDDSRRWQVAPVDRTILVRDGETLMAKACRIGFKDSQVVRLASGQPKIAPEQNEARPHWWTRVRFAGDQQTLAQLHSDGSSPTFVGGRGRGGNSSRTANDNLPTAMIPRPDTVRGVSAVANEGRLNLNDAHPADAIWQMNESGKTLKDIASNNASVLRDVIFRDYSPVPMKLTAARWLAEIEDPTPHLKLLVENLSHPQGSVQLQAITALADLGEKARPVIDDIRQATTGTEYIARVSQRALKKLEAKNGD